ncbi:MAG: Crp/Fnr family transcriptional regulator [Actinomycetota bacterium]
MLGAVFWDSLSPDDRQAVEVIAARRAYGGGETLFLEGDRPTHVLVVLRGQVKLTRSTVDGRSVLIEIRRAGAIVGESGPIDDQPRGASATALTAVEALVIPADAFVRLLADRGTVALQVIGTLVERLRESSVRRLESGTSDAVTRLAGRLVELSAGAEAGADGSVSLDLTLTQQDLAEWIGVSRDAVVLAFRQLRQLELVETGRRQITLLDRDRLVRFANPPGGRTP